MGGDAGGEQLVKLTFTFSGGEFGDEDEQQFIYDLEGKLEDVLSKKKVGDVDGHEFGDNECEIYLYGPDADSLLESIRPLLVKSPFKPVRVLQRYGDVDDQDAKEKESKII